MKKQCNVPSSASCVVWQRSVWLTLQCTRAMCTIWAAGPYVMGARPIMSRRLAQTPWAHCPQSIGGLPRGFGRTAQGVSAAFPDTMGALPRVHRWLAQRLWAHCPWCIGGLPRRHGRTAHRLWAHCPGCIGGLPRRHGRTAHSVSVACPDAMGALPIVPLLLVCQPAGFGRTAQGVSAPVHQHARHCCTDAGCLGVLGALLDAMHQCMHAVHCNGRTDHSTGTLTG